MSCTRAGRMRPWLSAVLTPRFTSGSFVRRPAGEMKNAQVLFFFSKSGKIRRGRDRSASRPAGRSLCVSRCVGAVHESCIGSTSSRRGARPDRNPPAMPCAPCTPRRRSSQPEPHLQLMTSIAGERCAARGTRPTQRSVAPRPPSSLRLRPRAYHLAPCSTSCPGPHASAEAACSFAESSSAWLSGGVNSW